MGLEGFGNDASGQIPGRGEFGIRFPKGQNILFVLLVFEHQTNPHFFEIHDLG